MGHQRNVRDRHAIAGRARQSLQIEMRGWIRAACAAQKARVGKVLGIVRIAVNIVGNERG